MQLLPMASSPDGLISARYAVIMKIPGWEVLTTTSNVGGGGGAKPVSTLFAWSAYTLLTHTFNAFCPPICSTSSPLKSSKSPFTYIHVAFTPCRPFLHTCNTIASTFRIKASKLLLGSVSSMAFFRTSSPIL